MAPQHDYILDNQNGAQFRADLNLALEAIATVNSGAAAPTTTYAYQYWADTTSGYLKQRDASNADWIVRGKLAADYGQAGQVLTSAGADEPAIWTSITEDGAWTVAEDATNSHYTFTGNGFDGTETNPTIYVTRGSVYNFTNADTVNGFQIQSVAGLGGAAYTDGTVNNPALAPNTSTVETLVWTVQMDAPSELYYHSTTNSGPGGKIYVLNNIPSSIAATPEIVLEDSLGATAGIEQTAFIRDNDEFKIQTRSATDVVVSTDYNVTLGTSGATSHQWSIDNAEAVRIDSSGNVGIGTTNIVDQLTIGNASNELLGFETASEPTIQSYNAPLHINTAGNDVLFDGVGNVGIGTSSPGFRLAVSGTGAEIARITRTDAGSKAQIGFSSTGTTSRPVIGAVDNHFTAEVGGSERMRIDSSGNLLVGTSNASFIGGGIIPTVQVENTTEGTSALSVKNNQNNAGGARLLLAKSRGTTVGSHTIVNADDTLGRLEFAGADGTDTRSVAASVLAEVDGTPGTDDMPGRLVFSTTADGASSPTEHMRIDSSGSVGIGTTSPSSLLHVAGSARIGAATGDAAIELGQGATANRNAYIDLVGDTTYTDYGLRLIRSDGGANTASFIRHKGTGVLTLETEQAGDLVFNTNATERLRINSSGNVGIGTSSPGYALDVQSGDIRIKRSASNDAALYLGNSSNNYIYGNSDLNLIALATNGSEKLRINSSGSVGIGTSSPAQLFHVNQSTAAQFATLRLSNADGVGLNISARSTEHASIVSTEVGDDLYFGTESTERLRIDSSGNVGIGTSAPRTGLDVSTTDTDFDVNNAVATATAFLRGGATSGVGNHGGSLAFSKINSTRPGAVIASYQATADEDQMGLAFFTHGSTTSNEVVSERVVLDAAGNVGIGTSNPGEKLEVNGTIKATDINFTGLATYADDAAAGTGGLVAGDVYKTSTGELRIKL